MNKNEKRQIISRKSVYKPKWSLMDEIQFQKIMFMLKKEGTVKQRRIRANVRKKLTEYGKNVEVLFEKTWKIF